MIDLQGHRALEVNSTNILEKLVNLHLCFLFGITGDDAILIKLL